ncbi:MAG: toxin-antitoxin system toxin component, PIN family protein [Anaerolineaceae bacterium 4572_78]|nr:MAG: toxin-antitoxin system toxin component, PIN family protein [Anaerolineaceae bacterium 4572_78]
MIRKRPLRAVIDTNVVFEGLTKQGGIASAIIDVWLDGMIQTYATLDGMIQTYATNALAYEYADVLSRKVLGSLLKMTRFVDIHYSWRPVSPDPGDDHIIDCAMNANAMVVTSNIRDFRLAQESLRLQVVSPLEFIIGLSGVAFGGERDN